MFVELNPGYTHDQALAMPYAMLTHFVDVRMRRMAARAKAEQ